MLRKLITAAAVAVPLAVLAAVPASANSSFYLVDGDGSGYALQDNGHDVLMTVDGRTTSFVQVAIQSPWFELQDGGGLCVDFGTNDYAYAESCAGTTSEQFTWHGTGNLEERHTGLNVCSTDSSGGYVYLSSSTTPGCQWVKVAA